MSKKPMPISDCEVRDPRIRRTRHLLQGALKTLMQTKGFDEISVQDKYSLLDATIAGGFHLMLNERSVRFDGTCPSAAGSIILAACDYLTSTHANSTVCNRQSAFEPLVDAAITTAIRRVLANGVPKGEDPAISSEMVAMAASWAIYGAVKQWFYTPNHPPAEEIVPSILQLVMPILQQAKDPATPAIAPPQSSSSRHPLIPATQ
jgi:hypothetical protein